MPSRVKKERSLLVQIAWRARRRASVRGMAPESGRNGGKAVGRYDGVWLRYGRTVYSYLNASTGSSLEALFAG